MNFKLKRRLLAAVLLACLGLGGYAVMVNRSPSLPKQVRDLRRNVVSDNRLSQTAEQYLKRQYLIKRFESDPLSVIKELQQPGAPAETPDRLYTLVEASLAQALAFEAAAPRAAADWHLFSAAKAYDALFAPDCRIYSSFDPRHERLRFFYARAVAGWVANQRRLGRIKPEERSVLGETYRTTIMSGPHLFDPNTYSELILALETDLRRLSSRSLRRGIGAPFVGWRENKQETKQDRYSPLAGVAQALSVTALFGPPRAGGREAALAFYDSFAQETIAINDEEVPLAADFSAAFAYQISNTQLRTFNIAHTLDIQSGLGVAGFYMLTPYRTDRIPLITVHGLFSSPLSWVDVTNDLLADPEIRRNYQMWHFFYPPGLPILISASLFRDKLDELLATLDPSHQSLRLENAVVLSHSMGGLLTRTVVSDSGDAMWLKLFGKTKAQLSLPPDLQTQLDKLLDFKPRDIIRRVIFVAVPHRGSQMSEDLIGRIGRSLVALPAQLVSNLKELHDSLQRFIDPKSLEGLISPEQLNSIRGLSPHSPAIQSLSQIAIARGVQCHSIIGAEGKTKSGEPSDGVVAYSSAHLEGAASELIIPSGHSAHTHPLAILEIKRILREHLREFERQHPEVQPESAPKKGSTLNLCTAMH